MIEHLELGRKVQVLRDGTGEQFAAWVEELGQWRTPVAILRLSPPTQLLIDATTGETALVDRIAAAERYDDMTGFHLSSIPVNLFRLTTQNIRPYENPLDRGSLEA